jgi:hypothetical protein
MKPRPVAGHSLALLAQRDRGQVMRKMKAASLPDLARMADKLNLTAEQSQSCQTRVKIGLTLGGSSRRPCDGRLARNARGGGAVRERGTSAAGRRGISPVSVAFFAVAAVLTDVSASWFYLGHGILDPLRRVVGDCDCVSGRGADCCYPRKCDIQRRGQARCRHDRVHGAFHYLRQPGGCGSIDVGDDARHGNDRSRNDRGCDDRTPVRHLQHGGSV